MTASPLLVITGQLAAGKSTIARALLDRFEHGLLLDIDAVREQVTAGFASPLDGSPDVERQFDLAIRGAAAMARVYRDAGFAVAIEGGLDPEPVDRALAAEGLLDARVGIELHPPLEIALQRNRARSKGHDPALLEPIMREIDAAIRAATLPPGWHRLDNGDEPVEATVERVLAILRKT